MEGSRYVSLDEESPYTTLGQRECTLKDRKYLVQSWDNICRAFAGTGAILAAEAPKKETYGSKTATVKVATNAATAGITILG